MHGGAPELESSPRAVRQRNTGKRPWHDTVAARGDSAPGDDYSPRTREGQAAAKRCRGAAATRLCLSSVLADGWGWGRRRTRTTRATAGPQRCRDGAPEEPGDSPDEIPREALGLGSEDSEQEPAQPATAHVPRDYDDEYEPWGDRMLRRRPAGGEDAPRWDDGALKACHLEELGDTEDDGSSADDVESLPPARKFYSEDEAGPGDEAADDESDLADHDGDNSEDAALTRHAMAMFRTKTGREECDALKNLNSLEVDDADEEGIAKMPKSVGTAEKNNLEDEDEALPREAGRAFDSLDERGDETGEGAGTEADAEWRSGSDDDCGPRDQRVLKKPARAPGHRALPAQAVMKRPAARARAPHGRADWERTEASIGPGGRLEDCDDFVGEGKTAGIQHGPPAPAVRARPARAVMKGPAARALAPPGRAGQKRLARDPGPDARLDDCDNGGGEAAGAGAEHDPLPPVDSPRPALTPMKRPASRLRAPPGRAVLKRPAKAPGHGVRPEPGAPPHGGEEAAEDGDYEGADEEPGDAVMRRPAQAPRRRKDTRHTCCKEPGCDFSVTKEGDPARTKDTDKCMFCCNGLLAGLLAKQNGKSVTQALKKLLAHEDEDIFERAADRARALGGGAVVHRVQTKRQERSECPGVLLPDGTREKCVFSTQDSGQPARLNGEESCPLCSAEVLRGRLEGGRLPGLLKQLRMKKIGGDIYRRAVARVRQLAGPDDAEAAELAIARSEPKKPVGDAWAELLEKRTAVRGPLRPAEQEEYEKKRLWDRAWVRRKFFTDEDPRRGAVTQEAEVAEQADMMPDGKSGDIADNDTGLPAASFTDRAKMAERWCKFGSWSMCRTCGSMNPRIFDPRDLGHDATPTTANCTKCRRKIYVPQPKDVPAALQGLSEEAVRALRPLDVDIGKNHRTNAGYRVHDAMMKFQWSELPVQEKIEELEDASDKKAAKAAFAYLQSCEESAYKDFVAKHKRFLAKNAKKKLTRSRRFLSLAYLEEPGIECCLWPHLYWKRDLCETVVRKTQAAKVSEAAPKKKAKRGAARAASWRDGDDGAGLEGPEGEDDDHSENGEGENTAHCVKHSFMTKVLSPVVGYSADYELLQFVYDLHMWTTLGAKKNVGKNWGVDFRLMLKKCSFSPEYWRTQHDALIDLQRQCGFPAVFRTRAPYEKSFPYHAWVLDEMKKEGRARQHLAGPETLHMAHVLRQLDAGLFSGWNRKTQLDGTGGWTKHIFGAEDGKTSTVVNFASRIEFQDGKRKPGTQKYRGRGTAHSHSLDFLKNLDAIDLPSKIGATLDAETPLMRAVVRESQPDERREDKRPLRDDGSIFDKTEQELRLRHTLEDKDKNVRAYVKETMEVTKCHEDAQVGQGRGNVLRYVASYDVKFSGSFNEEWQADEPSAYSVAKRILFDYHPLEPEMWLTIAGRLFPQITMGGKVKVTAVPWATRGEKQKPSHVVQYEKCSWRREDMTLLEWMRKSNKDGEIDRWVRVRHRRHVWAQAHRAHVQAGNDVTMKKFHEKRWAECNKYLAEQDKKKKSKTKTGSKKKGNGVVQGELEWLQESTKRDAPPGGVALDSLEVFANREPCKGEKLISATPYSMLSDRYYGQWLVLNVPFRDMTKDFCVQEIVQRVPDRYVNFALALHHRGEAFWHDDEKVKAEMALHAHRDTHIQTVRDKIRAHRHTVERYKSGELDKDVDVPSEEEEGGEADNQDGIVHRTHAQRRLERRIDAALAFAMKVRDAEEDEKEKLEEKAWGEGSIIAAIGEPGTGKTAIVHKCVSRWEKRGARILFALPTGQLAARMRARHPNVEVDTCHGGLLLHKREAESLPIMQQYDAVFVDELSMITEEHFGRIVNIWKCAGKVPALVLMGDFYQLPGPFKTPQKVYELEEWKDHVKQIGFKESVRCKDKVLLKKTKALRTEMPDKQMLREICRGHRAWRTKEPTGRDIQDLFARVARQKDAKGNPKLTTIVTCTRRAAARASELAVSVLFGNKNQPVLGEYPAPLSWESNLDNYDETGKLKDRHLEPKMQKLYKGMRVVLTKNMDKREDFVNGMGAFVEHYNHKEKCLEVVTETGKRLSIHLYTEYLEGGHGRVTSFPVRVGYATTIHKIQGATLELRGGLGGRDWGLTEQLGCEAPGMGGSGNGPGAGRRRDDGGRRREVFEGSRLRYSAAHRM